MMPGAPPWRAGYELLAERIRQLPDLLRRSATTAPPHSDVSPATVREFVTTGVGSSAAHARFLSHLLSDHVGVSARFVPLSRFVSAPIRDQRERVLVVITQGLSPNARLALEHPTAWQRVVLMTAASEEGAHRAGRDDERRLLVALRDAGVEVQPFCGGEDEFGTLVRVVGPMCGYVCALRFAAALAAAMGRRAETLIPDLAKIADVIAAAPARLAERSPEGSGLTAPLAFVTTGGYGECVDNLRFKVMEGMLLPPPPVWDVLHAVHGPVQQAYGNAATWIALERADAPAEHELLLRLSRALDPHHHRLLRLPATLPAPWAIFEHEALLNELMMRHIARAEVDQVRWPGRGSEEPLYELGRAVELGIAIHHTPPAEPARGGEPLATERRLEALTWPEIETAIASGLRTAVLALGSTEQHGLHLPFATDSWIGEALAARFCRRVPEALQLPTVTLGCSSEHMAFAGTLDVRGETLAALLADVTTSVRCHGFTCLFIFSAHGGNYDALRGALPALRRAAAPMQVIAFTDLAALTALFHRESAAYGVPPAASGHHAGEFETSIMRALRPERVRLAQLTPGLIAPGADPTTLFYPSLRRVSANGTVGDPRSAAAERAEHYLEAWVDVLVATYRRELSDAAAAEPKTV
jgi:creatinine amidohydrolase